MTHNQSIGFSFGTASIDALIDTENLIYKVPEDRSMVACITGPDGAGKSLLALTAASMFASRKPTENKQRVIYASTDLNYNQALKSWSNFGLHKPSERRKLLRDNIEDLSLNSRNKGRGKLSRRFEIVKGLDEELTGDCDLKWVSPFEEIPEEELSLYPYSSIFDTDLDSKERSKKRKKNGKEVISVESPCVNFLDLAAYSAGDDWGLLNRTLGLLQDIPEQNASHLLVLDAVEGLEAMVGKHDSFGLERSRRSRLAQLVRIARKSNCNVIFVIEQSKIDTHLDEVFVSDLVIRLGKTQVAKYQQKTIEVEKARSVSHVRGIHEYQIRSGSGGNSGKSPHRPKPDHPELNLNGETMGYFQAFPSLHIRNPVVEKSGADAITCPNNWFGKELTDLNALLSPQTYGLNVESHDPRDRVLVSVGDAGTLKSRLAYAFLAEAFSGDGTANNGAILLTSEPCNYDRLVTAIGEYEVFAATPEDQIMVRDVAPRFLSSSGFLFRVQMCIREMKRRLGINSYEDSARIRLVIDNWSTINESHPAIKSTPQILHALVRLLQREGVLAHLVSTQSGSPRLTIEPEAEVLQREISHDISRLEVRRIHTWPVDFFGGRRIACTTSLSSSSKNQTSVFELQRDSDRHFKLDIDRHFSLFEDLESGKAKRVDLRVKLYSGFQQVDASAVEDSYSYRGEVSALLGDIFPNSDPHEEVVEFESVERYNGFKEYVQHIGGSQLGETLVFSSDEFWVCGDEETDEVESNPFADLSLFLNSKPRGGNKNRKEQFEANLLPTSSPQNRVPLHKDFGIILADRNAWWRARNLTVGDLGFMNPKTANLDGNRDIWYPYNQDEGIDFASVPWPKDLSDQRFSQILPQEKLAVDDYIRVGHVWNCLCLPEDQFKLDTSRSVNLAGRPRIDKERVLFSPSWRVFLSACQTVAQNCGRVPYDIDLRTSETLSSNLLEIWLAEARAQVRRRSAELLSQIDQDKNSLEKYQIERRKDSSKLRKNHTQILTGVLGAEPNVGTVDLSHMCDKLREELLFSVRLLANSIPSRFHEMDLQLDCADTNAVAFRSWFAPATLTQASNRNLTPLSLPGGGGVYVRGDWHLGVARGSRSMMLAEQAVEKLVSLPMNLKRLREGVGIPVVDLEALEVGDLTSIESALTGPDIENNSYRRITLGELKHLESGRESLRRQLEGGSALSEVCELDSLPLFRSRIKDYQRDAPEFFRMITKLFRTLTPQNGSSLVSSDSQISDKEFDAVLRQFLGSCQRAKT